jgi:hypothetical protein
MGDRDMTVFRAGPEIPEVGLRGAVRDSHDRTGLAGYRIAVIPGTKRDREPLAVVFTHANGEFLLPGVGDAGADVLLEVRNRFGHIVAEIGPLDRDAVREPICIDVEVDQGRDRPTGPKPPDDLRGWMATAHREEAAALDEAGVRTGRQLLDADLPELVRSTRLSLPRLQAIRLHAEMSHAPEFDADVAKALVAAGIATREQLAGSSPPSLMRAVEGVRGAGSDARERLSPSTVYGWLGYAMGVDPAPFSFELPVKEIEADAKPLIDTVIKSAPHIKWYGPPKYFVNPFNRFQAVTEGRAHMNAAGVGDLSSLGTFEVRGRRVIQPGYYVAPPKPPLPLLFVDTLLSTLVRKGGAFKHLMAANMLPDALHLVPNPVTDAVIIGSLVDFIEDGRLVIGKDVSSLFIITEEISYSEVNEITYEDRDRSPAPMPPFSPPRAPTGVPNNNWYVYSPGAGDDGCDGGNGIPGRTGGGGFNGDELGPAPSVTIYVQRTPQGLPHIRMGGRRGGTGQPGQHGGRGGDGARGRGAHSGACQCHREAGHGGRGGNGGRGGEGGPGGRGGSGSKLKICTLPENIPLLIAANRPMVIDLGGGPGGNGGSHGSGGEGGRGGAPGEGSWYCDEKPDFVGANGMAGDAPKTAGANGPRGDDGQLELQPITLSDWNAEFNHPWIVRLEPWSAAAGTSVQLGGRNFTANTVVLLEGSDVVPSRIDVIAGTLDFAIPETAKGGLLSVQLRVPGVSGNLYSNLVHLRVVPTLSKLYPSSGVPGTRLTLSGSGFAPGAQVRFDDTSLPADYVGGSELAVDLPDHENIGVAAGAHPVHVVNPDGSASGVLNFQLSLDIHVRVKAWRVVSDPPEFTYDTTQERWVPFRWAWDDEHVLDVLTVDDKPADAWTPHQIVLDVDPNVGVAAVPADWAFSWPPSASFRENEKVVTDKDSAGNSHFDPGAVNIYFVEDIADFSTRAFTFLGAEGPRDSPPFSLVDDGRQKFIIYQDSALVTGWEQAHVAAHELGHVFGRPHVCGNEPGVTFGRPCEDSDCDFLMYPKTNPWTDEGNTLSFEEARLARRVARLWHGL